MQFVKCDIPAKDVTKVITIIGIGTTIHTFVDTNGQSVCLPCISYHLPIIDIRLFLPQTYHQLQGAQFIVKDCHIEMQLMNHTIQILIN